MKAIVLSCERYFPFMHHMVTAYEAVWPGHPFTFVVPCQSSPERWSSLYPGIKFVPAPREIRACVLTLLAGLPDDEWVYWCIDDKYPIQLDLRVADRIFRYVTNTDDDGLCGILFSRSRQSLWKHNIDHDDSFYVDESIKVLRRRYYWQIWYHQFLRAGVIRSLFSGFPDRDFVAREMDRFIHRLEVPKHQRLYVTERNYTAFGESTTRGKITKNCAKSMTSYGLQIPENFPTSDETIVMGSKPMLIEKAESLTHIYLRRLRTMIVEGR